MKDINLLPQDMSGSNYAYSEKKAGISAKAIIIAILVLLVFGATLVLPQAYIKTLEMELSALQDEIKDQKYDEVKKVRSDLDSIDKLISDKNDVINDIDNTNISVSELTTAIKSATPEGCELFALDIRTNGILIQGKAIDNLVVAEMVSNLSRLRNLRISSRAEIGNDNTFTLKIDIIGKAGK
jgi:Tfp pilus assembly protein PilN